MGYNIPYDSDYQDWYGVPQNVTRLSAVLEQTENEDGVPIGRITASWNVPDNGGTFVLLTSTDGTNFYVAANYINTNTAEVNVEPNTAYYVKVVTVLNGNQSTGTVSNLLPVETIPTPSAPTLTASQGGIQIDVGIIPEKYRVSILIGSQEFITTNSTYMYLCNPGTYSVSVAYISENGTVGTYSTASTITVGGAVQEYSSVSAFPQTGDSSVLYIDNATNQSYRWDSTNNAYYCIGSSYDTIRSYLNGSNTWERDNNGDIQPCEEPKPSLLWDIDSNNDIMPAFRLWQVDSHGDLMPMPM